MAIQEPERLTRVGDQLLRAMRRPVPADSVAVFRICYGLLVAFSSTRFLAKGWVDTLYLQPEHHLTYRWFHWIQPLPAPWMHLHVATLAVLGLAIAVGYRQRIATALFLVGFSYTELIEASLYLNHYWFITLAGVLMLMLPVNGHWSLDAAQGRVVASPNVVAGVVWTLRAQLAMVYLFAGLAKLNPDWLFRAQPLQLWLADRTNLPVVGALLDEPAIAYLASWSAAAFDCSIVVWLLLRRSRPYAFVALVGFHLGTALLFQIGVFPWVMILSALIFFEPDWPSRAANRLGIRRLLRPPSHLNANPQPRPAFGRSSPHPGCPPSHLNVKRQPPTVGRVRVAALVILAAVQAILPLRHYAMEGNVRWTEAGYYLSWRVMLSEKAGHVEYRVTDPDSGDSWNVDPSLVLTSWQSAHAATRPDLIHATSHLIARHYTAIGVAETEVRATAWVAINGRPAQQLVNPEVNLAAYPRGNAPKGWILNNHT